MAEKKSILEEALLDIRNIQSALNANTKEILRSVAREEIDSVVNESLLKEDDYEEEELSTEEPEIGMEPEMGAEPEIGLGGEDSVEDELSGLEDSQEVGPEMAPELGMDSDELGGEEMDMTAASDDDVIAIYKKLSGNDEIEIVGDEIHLNITEPGEYVVKANSAVGGETSMGAEDDLMGAEDEMSDDGVDYEIEMGDEDGEEEIGGADDSMPDDLEPVGADSEESVEGGEEGEVSSEEGEEEEEELDEAIRTNMAAARKAGGEHQPNVLGAKQLAEATRKYNSLLTESKQLKTENEEFRKALKVFRGQLVETVVFNSNLTYTTRLFMEHATTKAEKQNIIKRFDNEVSNLVESKKLFKAIANELETRKPMMESIESKLTKGVTSSTSKQLNENTAYVDPSTKRIMDLINRVEKR